MMIPISSQLDALSFAEVLVPISLTIVPAYNVLYAH